MKYLNYQKMYAQENFTHHYPLNLFQLRFCLQRLHDCSGQLKLATALEFFQNQFPDSFGDNSPLYSCGLSEL